ncbi:MAG TPA: glycosyltransferase family 2 protein [Blastocatellia bacterium]|nr:glycosyltransferase family 2 protein [Blastocatellia bacterium]
MILNRSVSVVIPTYKREEVLLTTIQEVLQLAPPPHEIIVVDQTPLHDPATGRALEYLSAEGKICWIRLLQPSITHAMNVGLMKAHGDAVLFLDDDILPSPGLIASHARAHSDANIVAGQVLQPGEDALPTENELEPPSSSAFSFRSSRRQYVSEFMGGNFSIKRDVALQLGGFDENFVSVAYRFEAEFAARALAAGERILFEPHAGIHHLKAKNGGTRSFGEHLTTIRPTHSVGAYYYLFRATAVRNRLYKFVARPLRAIRTRHHLSRPWWIPATLIAELLGFFWAAALAIRGPRLIQRQ